MSTGKTVELDVREDLKNKIEPFQKIMKIVKSLEDNDTFILHAPFKPKPLLPILKAKGFTYEIEEKDAQHWVVTFTKTSKKFSFSGLFKRKEEEQVRKFLCDKRHYIKHTLQL